MDGGKHLIVSIYSRKLIHEFDHVIFKMKMFVFPNGTGIICICNYCIYNRAEINIIFTLFYIVDIIFTSVFLEQIIADTYFM